MTFDRATVQREITALAAQQIFVGTSSWKYPGWRGQLYDDARYVYRGKFAQSRFERLCLAEYAEVFKTVSVDAAYYQFPTAPQLEEMISQVPGDFQFALKVTDEITVKRFPNLPRFGRRAGTDNANFLNAELFERAFLGACEPFRKNIGPVMFEFSRFHPADFARGRDFVGALDSFLGRLPQGWRYAVEIRNAAFLQPEYFAALARHGVAHVFNSWDTMPPVEEQRTLAGDPGLADFSVARFLLRPGRKYEEAVKAFSPYDRIQDAYPEGRRAGVALIQDSLIRRRAGYVYVNNRFEGNALATITALLADAAGGGKPSAS